jgi:hypothetical protein
MHHFYLKIPEERKTPWLLPYKTAVEEGADKLPKTVMPNPHW